MIAQPPLPRPLPAPGPAPRPAPRPGPVDTWMGRRLLPRRPLPLPALGRLFYHKYRKMKQ